MFLCNALTCLIRPLERMGGLQLGYVFYWPRFPVLDTLNAKCMRTTHSGNFGEVPSQLVLVNFKANYSRPLSGPGPSSPQHLALSGCYRQSNSVLSYGLRISCGSVPRSGSQYLLYSKAHGEQLVAPFSPSALEILHVCSELKFCFSIENGRICYFSGIHELYSHPSHHISKQGWLNWVDYRAAKVDLHQTWTGQVPTILGLDDDLESASWQRFTMDGCMLP